jgi:hypothetical protein
MVTPMLRNYARLAGSSVALVAWRVTVPARPSFSMEFGALVFGDHDIEWLIKQAVAFSERDDDVELVARTGEFFTCCRDTVFERRHTR